MKVVSVIHDSFSEYKGEHSLVLFSAGCNIRCPECYNLDEILNPKVIRDSSDIIDDCITPLHTAVVFLGGEPTIWKRALMEDVLKVKLLGLKVKIFTNGLDSSFLEKMCENKMVNSVSVDFKCIRDCKDVLGKDMSKEDYINTVCDTISIINSYNVHCEIRTTLWDCVLDQVEELKQLVADNFPNNEHIIQRKFYNVTDSR